MEKVKNFFSKIFSVVKSAFNNFPITVILISILTIIFVLEDELFSNELFIHLFQVIFFTICGTVLTEVILKKDKKKYIGIIASNAIAIGLDRLAESKIFAENIIGRWTIAYCAVCLLVAIYLLSKNCDKLEKYILNTFLNVKKHTIIYGIVCIGIIILYGIFSVLIGHIEFDLVGKLICLFTGFYYIPAILNSFTLSEKGEDTKFNKTVFTKVLLTLLIMAMIIIYIYIVKLLFVTGIPKNEVFTILSVIFVFLLPICVINKNYCEENNFLEKVTKILPVLFIPFIFLQVYAMGIRIGSYGLTEERYFAVIFMILEVISIIALIYKNGLHLRKVILFVIVFCLITLISPLNYEKAVIISQENIVKKYALMNTKFEALSKEDKRKYAGAYQYLNNIDEYEFKVSIDSMDKELLKSFYDFYDRESYYNSAEEDLTIRENYTRSISKFDITEYSKIYSVSSYLSDYVKLNNDFLKTEITLTEKENKEKINVDFTELVTKIMSEYEKDSSNREKIFYENNLIKIDNYKDLYIENIHISFDAKEGIATVVSIDGYVLERK